jgi:glycosyltransferase involved in cell wall biosynthesis
MRESVTALVTTLNEERNIQDCLASVAWADEILLVDSGSTDDTLKIAERFKPPILKHEYENAATQKNWAIPQAKHDWILVVDADERVSPELKLEIERILLRGPEHSGYYIKRENYFFGKKISYCGWQRDYVLRLFDRRKGKYEDKRVHADVKLEGKPGRIEQVLTHYTYRDWNEYFERFGRYTTWAAQDLLEAGKGAGFFNLFFRPLIRFYKQYIWHGGFFDGRAGLILCMLSAFSVFTKYAKLYRMRKDATDAPKH